MAKSDFFMYTAPNLSFEVMASSSEDANLMLIARCVRNNIDHRKFKANDVQISRVPTEEEWVTFREFRAQSIKASFKRSLEQLHQLEYTLTGEGTTFCLTDLAFNSSETL